MTFVLGVDGGTSKTKALIASLDGTVAGFGLSGGSNIYEGDPHAGLEHGMQAPLLALEDAGLQAEQIATSVFSMSGADWPEDMLLFRSAARAQSLGKRVVVVNDAVGGLRAGLAGPRAVGIICGTGGGTAARNDAGEYWHSSFWQQAGGALDLGREAIRAVFRADLGIDPATALTDAVLAHFDMPHPEELLHRQTALMAEPIGDVAKLAPMVLDIASRGDRVALQIVHDLAEGLADTGLAAARKVGIEHLAYDLVLGGSVFRHTSSVLPDAILTRMQHTSPDIAIVRHQHEPVFGALVLALEEHGVDITDAVIERIEGNLTAGWY